MTIKEHLVDVDTNVGVLTIIQTTRKNRPKDLPRPYEYSLSHKQGEDLIRELKELLKPFDSKLQCCGIDKKPISKGIRLNLFLLGYKPGYCGDDDEGISRKDWQQITKKVQEIYFKYLGKDARIFADKYTTEYKFQARHETYILLN